MSAPSAAPTRRLPHWLTSFGPQIVAGLILGVVIGLIARSMPDAADGNPNWLVETVSTIGSSYVKLLTVAVVPLVFTAIVSSIANLRAVTNAARLAGQTLLWFAITAFIAVIVGIIIGLGAIGSRLVEVLTKEFSNEARVDFLCDLK